MRNYYYYFLILLVFAFLSSCEIITYSEFAMPAYDGEFSWDLMIEDPDFSNRVDAAAVSFDGKLWLLGGYNSGAFSRDTYMEDIWCSEDGKSWERLIEDAPWKGRRGHNVTVFQGSMFLFGGYVVDEETGYREYRNDVWKSDDGTTWTELTDDAGWPARYEHNIVAAEQGGIEYLYLLGGSAMASSGDAQYSMTYYSDVWRSVDGENWTELTPSQDYGGRSSAGAAVDPDTGRIYLYGGMHTVMFDDASDGELNGYPTSEWEKVWYTDDGTTWEYMDAPGAMRANHFMTFYDDRIWILPGRSNSNEHYHYTSPKYYATYSFDGTDWIQDSEGSAVGARHGYAFTLHEGKLWVLGGTTGDYGTDNDVWAGEIK